jgi:hypothetical protein
MRREHARTPESAQAHEAPMTPLRLSDSELDAVFAAARPLDRDLRDPFLHAVARALSGRNMIGPGTVHQVCRELQRQFFDPPIETRSGTGKYR